MAYINFPHSDESFVNLLYHVTLIHLLGCLRKPVLLILLNLLWFYLETTFKKL